MYQKQINSKRNKWIIIFLLLSFCQRSTKKRQLLFPEIFNYTPIFIFEAHRLQSHFLNLQRAINELAINIGSQVLAIHTKNQIHLEIGQMQHDLRQSLTREESSSAPTQGECLFEKYKLGLAHLKAPFRLFDTTYSTSCQDDWDSEERTDRRARGPYRKYTFDEKMQAVQRILNGEDVKLISREFGIPRRNLLRWKKNGCQRKEGGGRPTDAALEQLIHDKIKSQELTDERAIRNFAMEYSRATSFKASKGWFVKFCHRFAISFDSTTEIASFSPSTTQSPSSPQHEELAI